MNRPRKHLEKIYDLTFKEKEEYTKKPYECQPCFENIISGGNYEKPT